jgi:DNA-binding SARP family transcriptional activator
VSNVHGNSAPAAAIKFRLLGPVEAFVQEQKISLGYAKHRLVLAILLAAGGLMIPTDRLIDQIWGDDLPASPRELLYAYVSQLRRNLDHGAPGAGRMLPSAAGGYRAAFDPGQIDIHRFRSLRASAQEQAGHDDAQAARLFRESLRQWGTGARPQGSEPPLADLSGRWADNYRETLREEHRATLIECLAAELRLGAHNQLIPELTDLANSNPLDEQVTALLMTALYRSGRQADALHVYTRTRAQLIQEIGIETSRELGNLYQRILQQDLALDPSQ